MVSRRTVSSVIVVCLFLVSAAAACRAEQAGPQTEQYVHHEYLYGTARVDYIENIDGQNMVTYYYKYEDPNNQFRVTRVEAFKGTRYCAVRAAEVPFTN